MIFRLVGCLLLLVTLGACQATSKYAGKGNLVLSKSAANGAERYFENYQGRAMAVSSNGVGWASTSCASQMCDWKKYGTAENNVVSRCELKNQSCGVFAIYQEIVWEGNISLPHYPVYNEKLFRLVERKTTSQTTTYSGSAKLIEGTRNFKLSVRISQSDCEGVADVENRVWNVDCYGKRWVSGKLESAKDSLFWGRAENKPFEMAILEANWPLLREKLNDRLKSKATALPEPKEVTRSIVLSVKNGAEKLTGQAVRVGDQKDGTLVFFDDKNNKSCEGSFEVYFGTTGNWQINCTNLGRMSGSLRIRSNAFSGKGRDSDGNLVTFSLKS